MATAAVCVLPITALGDGGRCVEGDCENGKGIYLYANGEKYDGAFTDGAMNGNGTYTYRDGSRYTGEFAKGVRHGQGTLELVGGGNYVGRWANDLPNGQGVKTLGDGMQYAGEFQNGLMYGIGTLIMPDDSRLKVKWSNALPLQKEWYMSTSSKNTQEPAPPTVSPEGADPQAPESAEVAAKEMIQPEEIGKSRLPEEEERQSATAAPVESQAGPEPQEPFPQHAETAKAVEYAHIAAGANIRAQASMTSEVLRTVPPGYPVIVMEKQADWFMVEDYRGRKGWVYASLVNKPGTVIIKVFKGNLRSGPSLQDGVIVQLDHGTILSVVERKGEWLKVSDLQELTGWLHHKVVWPETAVDE